jgi:hypothetical protein
LYTLQVPYKDFKGKPKNKTVQFNLTEREIFKLSPELNMIFTWRDTLENQNPRDLDPQEVIPYFTAFEEVLLTGWGELSDDGEHFRKGGRYDFEESACFNAALMMFVTDPAKVFEFLSSVLPEGMEERLKQQEENIRKLEQDNPEMLGGQSAASLQEEVERLRKQVAEKEKPAEG